MKARWPVGSRREVPSATFMRAKRRSHSSAGLFLLVTMTGSCGYFPTPEQVRARKEVDRQIAFVRPVTGGYDVAGSDGEVRKTVPVDERSWISSLTPDLSGFYFVRIAKEDSRLSVMVSLAQGGPQEVFRRAWVPEAKDEPRLVWSSADGRSFLVHANGSLWHWSKCESVLQRRLLAEDVKVFAVSPSKLYLIHRAQPMDLHWRNWEGSDEGRIELPEAYDHVTVGSDSEHLVFFKDSARSQNRKEGFAVLEVASQRLTPVSLLMKGEVYSLVPLKATTKAVVELWPGAQERLDGTELTEFLLWDYATGKVVPLFANSKMYQLHQRTENISEVPAECPQPAPIEGLNALPPGLQQPARSSIFSDATSSGPVVRGVRRLSATASLQDACLADSSPLPVASGP